MAIAPSEIQIIDTHCHLIDEAFKDDVEAVIDNAISAGVTRMILASCDNNECLEILALSKKHIGTLYPTIGIHPENIADDYKAQLKEFHELLAANKDEFLAIGEIGLDLHWDSSKLEQQKEILADQIKAANECNLPVLLHIRDAMPEFLEVLKNLYSNDLNGQKLRGIMHCYSGTIEQYEEAQKYADFLIGVGGTCTYKKSKVPEVAKHVGLNRIVLETDAPYLAPVPHRGQRNEPAYTAITAKFLADLFETSVEEVASITTHNAELLFNF